MVVKELVGVWGSEEEFSMLMVASIELVDGRGMEEEGDECLGHNKIN